MPPCLTPLLLILLCLLPAAARADGLNICYHYRCSRQAYFEISEEARDWLAARLARAGSAAAEREAVSDAVVALYRIAARDTPIWQDKGGNFHDGPAEGRMDCVDHSSNVTAFLGYLDRQGWLKFHHAAPPAWRAPWILDLHYTGVLHDIAAGQDWAVDTWFRDFGEPPVVVPLSIWMKGYEPPAVSAPDASGQQK
ncbi:MULTISPECIES: hypothetical protein [Chromobacterium]|uniref:hypothetical protein n=1 Tax=Chromobacterium TaxID=535 RepID=UPI000A8B8122|nr:MULTISPECIES: hypothetical protein [Chromobacterium]WSE93065.1 hypothetical protein U6115_07430 [Chromobacterium subtsugae]WVH61443.1 hypothetical protein U6151_07450 [Chromobacterium subtsugae]